MTKGYVLFLLILIALSAQAQVHNSGKQERDYLVNVLVKIAAPVLTSLSENKLKQTMPVEGKTNDRPKYTYLEAFGRLLSGMAPWLELGADNTAEGKLRQKYILLARKSLHNATDPVSPDFLNFKEGRQPLVDAAFLAQGLLRAQKQLWEPLDTQTKKNIIAALKSSRTITPGQNNWLLFSAMVEAAILRFEGSCDMMRINYALNMHELWYKGDGTYGDGPNYHWDYYNSFVIQPMLLEVTHTLYTVTKSKGYDSLYHLFLNRSMRYAAVQERLISPEGTYPAFGRSLAYRFGAFQLLSKIALSKALPSNIKPQQVRAALYTLIKKQIEAPGTFDNNNWLQIGLYGHQPSIGEAYISTGSLYLCSEGLLMLGLSPSDDFWNGDDEPWTSKKLLNGMDLPTDHAHD